MVRKVRRRLDEELVEQGLFVDIPTAARAVMAGEVSCGGERITQPGTRVEAGIALHIKGSPRASLLGRGRYVGRGGLKLEGALAEFGVDVTGCNCLDVGCSTGGFTDCLLKAGASRVAAVDVGYGQFDWGLRGDGRVSLFERTNICDADGALLGAPFDVAVADVSFTSVERILPAVMRMLAPDGVLCTLVKPQFEAARDKIGPGGVVDDPSVHRGVLLDVVSAIEASGLSVEGLCPSPIKGAKGNIEFFALARRGSGGSVQEEDVAAVVERAWDGRVGSEGAR